MGLWSKIKGAVRAVVRVVVEAVNRFTVGLLDLVFGALFVWIGWPPKRLRLHVFILWSQPPPVIEGGPPPPIEQVVDVATSHRVLPRGTHGSRVT